MPCKLPPEKTINLVVLLVRILFSINNLLFFSLTTRLFINNLPTFTGYKPFIRHLLRIFLIIITSSRIIL